MDKYTKALWGLAVLLAVAVVLYPTKTASAPTAPSATVEVVLKDGHGSGVHIGHGIILTAAHVVGQEKTVTVRTTDGFETTAEVQWSNTTYDVAMIRIDPVVKLQERSLRCGPLYVGEAVRLEGNPFDLGLQTTYGHIIEHKMRPYQDWKIALHVDAMLGPGMSGGPTLDANGNVIGINVGAIPGYGFGVIVPNKAICQLMGKL